MPKVRIEIQITFLSVIIAATVITTGYLGYANLSQIVGSIHRAAVPDNKLFLIKDIASDLSEIENNARLYVLTNEAQNGDQHEVLQESLSYKLQYLIDTAFVIQPDDNIVDSIYSLSIEKLRIWEGVIKLHESTKGVEPAFTEIYSKIEEPKVDTITTEQKKKGLFRKIFGTKKVDIDTTIVVRELKKDEIKQEIVSLESEIREKGEQINILESHLIVKNLEVTEKLNELILTIEKQESDKLVEKTYEANRLAVLTYKWLAAFSITAVVLLLLVLFLLYNYMRKSRSYQRALKSAKQEAEAFAHAKEQFAANVSHEIRTPINAIYGLSEQLLQKNIEGKAKEQLVVLLKSAAHLKNIVNDTLDFSKIQANKLRFEKVHFSPSELFGEVVAIQRSEAITKKLELKFEKKGKIAETLIGDPLRLKQILLNLIQNSLKFTNKGYISLLVESVAQQDDTFLLKMVVEDTGIGISKEDQQIVFEEFVQAKNKTEGAPKGTGLGLSIVKKLVELQGGKINIESEPNKGTKFFVEIPFPKGNPDLIPSYQPIELAIPDSFKNLSVLIVDDEEYNRFLLKGIFEKWGVSFREATNGDEATDVALNEEFDLILMDINMPGMNGIEATTKILGQKPKTKIIAVPASNDQADLNACIQAGMVGFLPKPFSEADLFNVIIDKLDLIIIQKNEKEDETSKENTTINFEAIKRLANDDEVFFKEMLEIYLRSSKSGMSNIEKGFASKNYGQITEAAHKLAAPTKHIQAELLHSLLVQLEDNIKAKMFERVNIELIERIRKEVDLANASIREFLKVNFHDSKTPRLK